MLTMFIGGSPASIAGGVKTTTVYTIVRSVFCFGRGKAHLIAHNREIKSDSILKSYVLVTISVIFIGLMTFFIVVLQPGLSLKAGAFEAVSAFATCGTSLGITSQFNVLSKIGRYESLSHLTVIFSIPKFFKVTKVKIVPSKLLPKQIIA